MTHPLVSIIIPTRNSADVLEACLKSIVAQTYNNIEIIVVDRDSKDGSKVIAKKYTKHVFNQRPERSAQRNYGANRAKGDYLVFIDSDMELEKNVIEQCVTRVKNKKVEAVIIPEKSFGRGFWAQCKALERSFYVGNDAIEAARFFSSKVFESAGAYDTEMISGEDWDLSNRVRKLTSVSRINSLIMHNEGKISLKKTLSKKIYYAKKAGPYLSKNKDIKAIGSKSGVMARYIIFFSHPIMLFKNPFLGVGMLFMKTCEFASGVYGILVSGSAK